MRESGGLVVRERQTDRKREGERVCVYSGKMREVFRMTLWSLHVLASEGEGGRERERERERGERERE
jgi:hypothetical protein